VVTFGSQTNANNRQMNRAGTEITEGIESYLSLVANKVGRKLSDWEIERSRSHFSIGTHSADCARMLVKIEQDNNDEGQKYFESFHP
jgi:hypothetical protein